MASTLLTSARAIDLPSSLLMGDIMSMDSHLLTDQFMSVSHGNQPLPASQQQSTRISNSGNNIDSTSPYYHHASNLMLPDISSFLGDPPHPSNAIVSLMDGDENIKRDIFMGAMDTSLNSVQFSKELRSTDKYDDVFPPSPLSSSSPTQQLHDQQNNILEPDASTDSFVDSESKWGSSFQIPRSLSNASIDVSHQVQLLNSWTPMHEQTSKGGSLIAPPTLTSYITAPPFHNSAAATFTPSPEHNNNVPTLTRRSIKKRVRAVNRSRSLDAPYSVVPNRFHSNGSTGSNGSSRSVSSNFCQTCSIQFADLKQFRSHMRENIQCRPFKCNICPMRFSRKDMCRRHQLTHTDDKPHKCPGCDRGFKRVDHLSAHVKKHCKLIVQLPVQSKKNGKQESKPSARITGSEKIGANA